MSYANQEAHKVYTNSKCLGFGMYKISFSYSKQENWSSIPSNVTYLLTAEEAKLIQKSSSQAFQSEEFFTVCSSEKDCNDFDGCTNDICDYETGICENKAVNDTECNSCAWVSVELVLDNYLEEISWDLAASIEKTQLSVLSGE